jgi:murein DD-endopeptidase MepM/ murein hydrolase activator NlpD
VHLEPVRLPGVFTATHETAGLPAYPAIDIFGEPGAEVLAGFYGIVIRISGRDCAHGGTPGGAYGRSLYIHNRANGWTRFVTHLDQLLVLVGARIGPGSRLATLCDSAVTGRPHTTHAHLGLNRGARTAGD